MGDGVPSPGVARRQRDSTPPAVFGPGIEAEFLEGECVAARNIPGERVTFLEMGRGPFKRHQHFPLISEHETQAMRELEC
jgi:hypothetical protein